MQAGGSKVGPLHHQSVAYIGVRTCNWLYNVALSMVAAAASPQEHGPVTRSDCHCAVQALWNPENLGKDWRAVLPSR